MPSYDLARGRFRLADRHIAVLGHLHDRETPPDELAQALAELQDVGLVGPEGELAPELRDLIDAFAHPVVLVRVEVTGPQGLLQHGLVVGPETVIAHQSWPGEEESEYQAIQPATLVWEIARLTGLRDRPAAEPAVPTVTTTVGALDRALAALETTEDADAAAGERTGVARAALATAEPSLPGDQLECFAALVAALTGTWRVTVAWGTQAPEDPATPDTPESEPGTALRALAVWDCGELGYWVRDRPVEPVLPGEVTAASALHLVPATASALWERITGLLPEPAELVGTGAGPR